jgi:hypothetical protein
MIIVNVWKVIMNVNVVNVIVEFVGIVETVAIVEIVIVIVVVVVLVIVIEIFNLSRDLIPRFDLQSIEIAEDCIKNT